MKRQLIILGVLFAAAIVAVASVRETIFPDEMDLPANAPAPQDRILQPFECTLYYTPRETGFRAEEGFDVTPETRPGLGGKTYPKDFLTVVEMEGSGLLAEPVDGKEYIHFDGRHWWFSSRPTGSSGMALQAKGSCAMSRKQSDVPRRAEIEIISKTIAEVFGTTVWQVVDTGGALDKDQIDLYWGEDDPRGPSPRDLFRPAGTEFERISGVPIALK